MKVGDMIYCVFGWGLAFGIMGSTAILIWVSR